MSELEERAEAGRGFRAAIEALLAPDWEMLRKLADVAGGWDRLAHLMLSSQLLQARFNQQLTQDAIEKFGGRGRPRR